MKLLQSVPLLACITIAGCASSPATAQPDPVTTRLDRIDSRLDDQSEDSAALRERITDNRFADLADTMAAGFDLIADTMVKGFDLIVVKMTETNDQRKTDVARLEDKIIALEEAARVPWYIIAGICVGAPAVGGGSYIAGSVKGNGKKPEPEPN